MAATMLEGRARRDVEVLSDWRALWRAEEAALGVRGLGAMVLGFGLLRKSDERARQTSAEDVISASQGLVRGARDVAGGGNKAFDRVKWVGEDEFAWPKCGLCGLCRSFVQKLGGRCEIRLWNAVVVDVM